MKAKTDEALLTAKETVELFNGAKSKRVKDNLRDNLKHDLNSLYVRYDKEKDEFIINDILPKLELYNFQINKITYGSGLSITRGYEDNGIDTINKDYIRVKDSISTKKLSFKDAFLQYAGRKAANPFSPQLLSIEKEQPLVREAYQKLGEEKVRSLRYIKKKVESALIGLEKDKTTEQKIAKMITNTIKAPDAITVAKANNIIAEAYQ